LIIRAARGYWQAFRSVQKSLERVLKGENPGMVARDDHGSWYREMFAPGNTAGIIRQADGDGYRKDPVFISRSRYVPPRGDAVLDFMTAFFELVEEEDDPAARIVLGHFVFVFIHPYLDGNGRMGRFMMNLMMADGGYPWVVVPVGERKRYMGALERASISGDLGAFARFLGELERCSD